MSIHVHSCSFHSIRDCFSRVTFYTNIYDMYLSFMQSRYLHVFSVYLAIIHMIWSWIWNGGEIHWNFQLKLGLETCMLGLQFRSNHVHPQYMLLCPKTIHPVLRRDVAWAQSLPNWRISSPANSARRGGLSHSFTTKFRHQNWNHRKSIIWW